MLFYSLNYIIDKISIIEPARKRINLNNTFVTKLLKHSNPRKLFHQMRLNVLDYLYSSLVEHPWVFDSV